ncbi:MAG TPA: glycosyltransferase family 2 protein [Dissulfurispiraceae bacterium]|nr:glycosyltransferase family 2 protein [Dissulfurispiraceae bacterium]
MSSEICVVIPAFNAEETLDGVVRGALKYVSKVIVADDGSTDRTASVASDAGADVILIGKNYGKGNALKTLFNRAAEAGFSAVISMDADGQHDPGEIPKFIAEHERCGDCIVVGSRMHDKDKIPKARYNSMHIARFYVSLVSNQFVEDTQCGYRLYPLEIIRQLKLVTGKYVTETELLMKAGDMGRKITFVNIRTIYGETGSHFRPITDVTLITAYVISYVHIKWLIEGVTSNNANTYTPDRHLRDMISRYRIVDNIFMTLTAFTALPASIFYLLEYILLPLFVPNNFASIRKLGCGFARITLATQMLPVTLIVAVIQKLLGKAGIKKGLVDRFILKFYPHLW